MLCFFNSIKVLLLTVSGAILNILPGRSLSQILSKRSLNSGVIGTLKLFIPVFVFLMLITLFLLSISSNSTDAASIGRTKTKNPKIM